MAGIERVRTARLVGARPVPRDADLLHPLMADERVAAWLWPGALGGPRTPAQVRGIVLRDCDHWRRHRFGPWIVRDARDGSAVGRIGLMRTEVGGSEEVELAWLVAPARWGEGLATEMARAALTAAFGDLGLSEVVAFTLPHNAASRAVMEKLGMAYERDVVHAGLPHVLYRRRAPAGG